MEKNTEPKEIVESRGRGRPSTYTPEIGEAICAKMLESGTSLSTAASLCGLSAPTVREWAGHNPAFASMVAQARASQTARRLAIIEAAQLPGEYGGPDWRAQAWILERQDREFTPKAEVKQESVSLNLTVNISAEQLAEIQAQRERSIEDHGRS